MAVLSNRSIVNFQESGSLKIVPFYPASLQPASYDMRLHWKLLVSPTRYERGRVVDLREEPNNTFAVHPGRFIAILTEETITLSLGLAGRFGLRSEFTRQGLVAFPGIQIDPGFMGRLAISLFNAGPEPILMVLGRQMFTVEFHTLETPADEAYSGDFQNQQDFPEVQEEFVLNAHTVSLAEIATLPAEVAAVRQQLAIIEAEIHPERTGITAQQLAVAQRRSPVDDPTTLLGGWPEDDDYDEFLHALHTTRDQG